MCLCNSPQISTAVVVISHCNLPGIFINIEIPHFINMALAILEGGPYMPNPVQFVPRETLVNMARLDDIVITQIRSAQSYTARRDEAPLPD